ncbi:MAG: hypothetical protein JNL72_09595 [Flavipsychrobacter sp.]|nr:hypothetical protein [Flavipsychrobacter sp.]
MASWIELVKEFNDVPNQNKGTWLEAKLEEALNQLSGLTNNSNVIIYGSAYLQKPASQPINLQIAAEDINGFMSALHGMDCSKGLTLVLHSPGGISNAPETIVSYLRSKFGYIQTIIPTFAMSAATMVALSSDLIVMGRQSQMGPIDPQMPANGRTFSALAILDQFKEAEKKILEDKGYAHVYAPMISSLGPALLQESKRAIEYGRSTVAKWLETFMFKGQEDASAKAAKVAEHFSSSKDNTNHGRRIDRDEARSFSLNIQDLESDQPLQESTLTLYHVMTLLFLHTPTVKIIATQGNKKWLKNEMRMQPPPGGK